MVRFLETVRASARGHYKLKKQTGGPGQYAGLLMLAALMGLAFYNDIVHRILS